MTVKYGNLITDTASNKPPIDDLEVGQLWINTSDLIIGTKNTEGNSVEMHTLSKESKEALDKLIEGTDSGYVPSSGNTGELTNYSIPKLVSDNQISLNKESIASYKVPLTADGLVITASTDSTSDKIIKLWITKEASVTGAITWNNITHWMTGGEEPDFGNSAEAETLVVALMFTGPYVVGNVLLNTENPNEDLELSVPWGEIVGDISKQTDLFNTFIANNKETVSINATDNSSSPTYTSNVSVGATVETSVQTSEGKTTFQVSATDVAIVQNEENKSLLEGYEKASNAIPKSGNRNALAGYEQASINAETSITITETSPDTIFASSATSISISDGSTSNSFIKIVYIPSTVTSITATANYTWVGGSVPDLGKEAVLVVSWCNSRGLLNLLS